MPASRPGSPGAAAEPGSTAGARPGIPGLFPATLVRGARLVTVGGVPAPDGPVDVRVRDGMVTQVAPRLSPERDEAVHDAAGRWAVPGLWDHHVHMAQWALTRQRLDLSGTGGPDDALSRVRQHVASRPPEDRGLVVTGFGHRLAAWERVPTVAELDTVSGGHPVVLIGGDAHNGWLNSAALALLGVPPRQGPLDENDWFPLFSRLATLPGATEVRERAVAEAAGTAAARGVVGIGDMEFEPGAWEWQGRFARGVRSLRVRPATYPGGLHDVVAAGWRSGDTLGGSGGLVRMGALKIISDGSLNTRTAYCCEPYAAGPAGGAAGLTRGTHNTPPEELLALLARATGAGLEIALHAIGDAAVGAALDAFEATGARGGIEHAQLVATADLPRMARLGVRASVQPAHLLDDRDVTDDLWPDRAERCYAFRSMLDHGVTLALGSDAPVAPLDPWLAVAAAVHRSGDHREPWHPEQAITAAEALAASTDGQCTIGVGSRGDLVLLDEDPLGRDLVASGTDGAPDPASLARRLRGIPVAATFLGGRATHLAL